jgi:NhaP-type Na+/H+ or K+/H+ antiporter
MVIEDPALIFAVALAAGMISQITAVYLRVPGIVLLLIVGVLLGPDLLNIVRPEVLGEGLDHLVELAVAVILFEGALNLNLERIRREAKTIQRLITVGALVTAIGGAAAARLFIGWSWSVSMLFGTLVIVTGPTVIIPLLRRIRVQRNVHTILEAEAVFIDPVGAIIAVVALEVMITTGVVGLVGIPYRLLVGALMGAAGGLIIAFALRNKLVPEELENVFTLSMVLAVFEISNWVIEGSGIMDTVVAGLVVGNMTRGQRTLREFKEQLTVMLVGLLFVLLAADVRLAQVADLGLNALAIVFALMLVVRPLAVALSTAGSGLSWRERAFIAWIGPRGIVAAAVASFFAVRLQEAEFGGGDELRALVFSVIALTVVVQGLTGGLVSRILRVNRPSDTGFVIVGANPLGRALAHLLVEAGEEVVLIDSNAAEAARAEQEGLRAIFGNAYEDRLLMMADLEGRRGFVAVTTNEGVNVLLARKAREEFRVPSVFAALHQGKHGVGVEQLHDAGAAVLFGRPIEVDDWNHELEVGNVTLEKWRYRGGPANERTLRDLNGRDILPLALRREDRVNPAGDHLRVRDGDVATFACRAHSWDMERDRLRSEGWEEVALLQPQ